VTQLSIRTEKVKRTRNIDPGSGKSWVNLYLKGLDMFFPCRPHPGNIFVLPEGFKKNLFYRFLVMANHTCPIDKKHNGTSPCFFKKRVKKIIQFLQKIALKNDYPDEKKLEYDLYELVERISNTSSKILSWNYFGTI